MELEPSSNLSSPLDLQKLNISNDLNITQSHLEDFLWFLKQMKEANQTKQLADECEHYCNGSIRDYMTEYKSVHGYLTLMICIFGTVANILNIVTLRRPEMGKTPINSILKWLSVTDMFVMIEYIPFTIYMYIISLNKTDFSYCWAVFLLFHMHYTQILHTISISLTVTLALCRYIAIKHPHGRIHMDYLSRSSRAILFSFVISPILCFPTYFVFQIKEKEVVENNTRMSLYYVDAEQETKLYRFNFWIHSILIKLLPCCVLTVISCVLIGVLCKASKRKIRLKEYNATATSLVNGQKPNKSVRRTDRTTALLISVLVLFLLTEFPQGILGLLSGVLKKCFFKRCYTLFGELMDLLALIYASVGFVLYGLMSKQFRTSFKAIFVQPKPNSLEMTRVTATTTCV